MKQAEAERLLGKIDFEGGFFEALNLIGVEEILMGTPYGDPAFTTVIERALQIEFEFMNWLADQAEI